MCELLTLQVAPMDPPRLDLQQICLPDIIVWGGEDELDGKYLSSPSPQLCSAPTSDQAEVGPES